MRPVDYPCLFGSNNGGFCGFVDSSVNGKAWTVTSDGG